jgi:hypothetical protein
LYEREETFNWRTKLANPSFNPITEDRAIALYGWQCRHIPMAFCAYVLRTHQYLQMVNVLVEIV